MEKKNKDRFASILYLQLRETLPGFCCISELESNLQSCFSLKTKFNRMKEVIVLIRFFFTCYRYIRKTLQHVFVLGLINWGKFIELEIEGEYRIRDQNF